MQRTGYNVGKEQVLFLKVESAQTDMHAQAAQPRQTRPQAHVAQDPEDSEEGYN